MFDRKPEKLAETDQRRLLSGKRAVVVNRLKALALRFGFEVRRHQPSVPPTAEVRRTKLLSSRGVTLVIDVGANSGQYACQLRHAGYRDRIVSFEPLSQAFAELSAAAGSDSQWECKRLALGNSEGPVEINVAGNSYSSSVLEMKERHLQSAPESGYVSTETVPMARLDTIWPEIVKPEDRVFLKLDVQGFELEVLRGGDAHLADLAGVQVELSLVPLYDGAPLFREVIDYLEDRGFRLAGLEPGFEDPESGEMLQADGLFVRS